MKRQTDDGAVPSFGQRVLAELRDRHYRPTIWVQFMKASWRQAYQSAQAYPRLAYDWRDIVALLGLLGLGASARIRVIPFRARRVRYWCWLWSITAVQLGDVYICIDAPQVNAMPPWGQLWASPCCAPGLVGGLPPTSLPTRQ
jgi:hypothetical protein